MARTDVLFIHPGNQQRTYQGLANEFTAIAPPVWTSLLAHAVRRNGYTVRIYDVNVEGWDERVPSELITRHDPALVVIMVYGHHPSASTQTMPAAGRIARDFKHSNPDIPVAMGGPHPSALPERTLQEESVDFVVRGEGLSAILGLVRQVRGIGDLADVSGLSYRGKAEIAHTKDAVLISDLDQELDGYAWDLLPSLNRYRAHTMHCFQDFNKSRIKDFSDVRTPYLTMQTSLGCPYACSYCSSNAIFGKPGIRYWSLDTVMQWIDTAVTTYGVRTIRLDDELFILSPERVERFCDLLIERAYGLNLWVYGRVDTIGKTLLRKLKLAGVNWICLGIESGNERVRNQVNKQLRSDIREVVRSVQDHGISVLGNFMFGLPEDDAHTMEETLQLALSLKSEFVNFYTVMAYPGSELYAKVAGKKGYLPDGWEGFSQHGYDTRPLPTNSLKAADVLAFRDAAFHRYFTDPAYQSMIESRFGPSVLQHIHRMLAVPMRRRLLE